MKGPGPVQRIRHRSGLRAEHLGRNALDPALHLGGGAPREGEQHHAARIDPADDQMGDAIGQRVGLSRACARDDEQRRSLIEASQPCSTARRCSV